MKIGFQFNLNGTNYIVCDIKKIENKTYANVCADKKNPDYKIMEIIKEENKIKLSEVKDKNLLSKLITLFINDEKGDTHMKEKYLPVGTVVMLKGGQKRVMITGFVCKENESNKIYDYCGCLFPEGFISPDKNLLFNHNQIEKIYHMGLNDEEEMKFKTKLKAALKTQI